MAAAVVTPSSSCKSILFDPFSHSLALSHSDSFSLYPSPSATPQTIPSSSSASSAAFLRLSTTTLFLLLTPSPSHLHLRFYLLHPNSTFHPITPLCNHHDFHPTNEGNSLLFTLPRHDIAVKLIADVNVLTIYSLSNAKVWVFAIRMMQGEVVKVMKSAVIRCCSPVFSIGVAFGYLVLGEDNGVRVFPLRRMLKGRRVQGDGDLDKLLLHQPNTKHSASTRLRTLKLRQDSEEVGACFVEFKHEGVVLPQTNQWKSVKAICIQSLSPKRFLILDSVGQLHMLCLFHPVGGSDMSCLIKNLPQAMKIHRLAVFPDISAKNRTVWVSDGHNSIHMLQLSEMDTSGSDNNEKDTDEQKIQLSVPRTIFSCEKIREIVAIAPNAILVLGQGNILSYDFS